MYNRKVLMFVLFQTEAQSVSSFLRMWPGKMERVLRWNLVLGKMILLLHRSSLVADTVNVICSFFSLIGKQ